MNGKKLASDFKFYSGNYSKYLKDKERYETWEESVERVMNMHRIKYADKLEVLEPYLKQVEEAYKQRYLLGSQRALQFGFADSVQGILKHNSKLYNCLSSYADRPAFFQEAMYWLLSGCGIGFRIFEKDITNYKNVSTRNKGVKTFVISDDIEGWSDAIGVIVSSYLSDKYKVTFPDYQGFRVDFDYSKIRPEGALISGGFKAPGSEGLRKSIQKIEALIESRLKTEASQLRTIDVYDIIMHMSDAVLSGGVRRSATICLFHKDDELMLNAKTGNWYQDNAQRARSNNSVLLLKGDTTKEEFDKLFESIKQWGEPGFIWTDDYDITFNPCVEIGKYPRTEDGRSGWQGCNLTEQNGAMCTTPEEFYMTCEVASIMGTLQAGYTDFSYVDKTSPAKEIFEREALLGCSITGFTSNPDILFNEEVLKKGASIVKETNKKIASLIGIRPAARTTCTKPSGNASVLLMTPSGIHGDHSARFFRCIQVNKQEEIGQKLKDLMPKMFEESVWSANNTDWVMYVPIENTNSNSLFKDDLLGVNLLEKVLLVQKNWVEEGTNINLCVNSATRHNVSNTINVDSNWDEVRDYIYNNRKWFAGVSLLSNTGDKDYAQAPFTSVKTESEILLNYGKASLFASGLIVDGLAAFNNDLWKACTTALFETHLDPTSENALKIDWVRRFNKFAETYYNNDKTKTSYLLKDVALLHKWEQINSSLIDVKWQEIASKPNYSSVSSTSAIACSGGSCELF